MNDNFRGAWKYSDVVQMGTKREAEKLEKLEKSVQPNDLYNIQYTSVRKFAKLL